LTRKRTRTSATATAPNGAPHPFAFFDQLKWLDGRKLMDTIEEYRRRELAELLYTFDAAGRPRYNRALRGRAKKNNKTTDLVLCGLYRFMAWPSVAGNDCYTVANDDGQARDDHDLLKKLIEANPILSREVEIRAAEVVRRDGHGRWRTLPAQDAIGAHGKTYLFLGHDEIHGLKDYNLIEALAPDPTRSDALVYFTSYAPLAFAEGRPLYDLFHAGRRGDDPRYHFAWYGGDYTTDPDFAGEDVTPEQRANPSMKSWGNDSYLTEQKRRLPTHRYRRLHLNLPGAPDGAAFDAGAVMAAIVAGRKSIPIPEGCRPVAAVDMSGGSNDHATLAIAYLDTVRKVVVLAHLSSQTGRPPFNPRHAVKKFAGILRDFNISSVVGDNYAGETFKQDFADYKIKYISASHPKTYYYEEFEPPLLASEVELLDVPVLQEQLLGLVWRGQKIDHQTGSGDHDDYANSVALVVYLARNEPKRLVITDKMMAWARRPAPGREGYANFDRVWGR
jgi:hypothetical protein